MSDLYECERAEEAYDEVWGCNTHGETGRFDDGSYCTGCQEAATGFPINVPVDDEWLCPNCCTPWKCNGPRLLEGAEVTAYGKPGTVRWVTPWASVAVVFEDGQMLWFAGEDVGDIEARD